MADTRSPVYSSGGGTTTQLTNNTSVVTSDNTAIIAGLMGFAGLFALIGTELAAHNQGSFTVQNGKAAAKGGIGITGMVGSGGKVIIGTTVGTALLVLISHAGRPGYKFSVGLATLVAVSSMLVYGAPVWKALSGQVGSVSSPPTGVTTSTGTGVNTVATYQTQLPEMAGEAVVGTIV